MAWWAPEVMWISSAVVGRGDADSRPVVYRSAIAWRIAGKPKAFTPGPPPAALSRVMSTVTGGRWDRSGGLPVARSMPGPVSRCSATRVPTGDGADGPLTYVPLPWVDVNNPSPRSSSSAWVIVARLTDRAVAR